MKYVEAIIEMANNPMKIFSNSYDKVSFLAYKIDSNKVLWQKFHTVSTSEWKKNPTMFSQQVEADWFEV